jgi:hypothetical protein
MAKCQGVGRGDPEDAVALEGSGVRGLAWGFGVESGGVVGECLCARSALDVGMVEAVGVWGGGGWGVVGGG